LWPALAFVCAILFRRVSESDFLAFLAESYAIDE
jgi:hypothetical protein